MDEVEAQLLRSLVQDDGEGFSGDVLQSGLVRAGVRVDASQLLVLLLRLEQCGLVDVDRNDGYRFRLSAAGEAAAERAGEATREDAIVLMADLVGFVAFTAEYGDEAAHQRSHTLGTIADEVLNRRGGRLVKVVGDGIVGLLPITGDPVDAAAAMLRRCDQRDGLAWQLRAGAHKGQPITHNGDIYGYAVNLAARLCVAAMPDEIVCTATDVDGGIEWLEVRGLLEPVAVQRRSLK